METKEIIYEGLKLHKGQRRIIDGIIFNNPVKYNIVNLSRQVGKTTMLKQLALYYAINNKNTMTMFCEPTHAQAKRVYEEIVNAIVISGVIKNHNSSDRVINLINGSKILFTGIDNPDALRGNSVHYMILDEFAFYSEYAWKQVLKPMLNVTGRQCIFVSTPKGKHNIFYEVSAKGMDEEFPNYKYFHGDYRENPYSQLSEIEDAKLTLPDFVFRQEYLAEFIDNNEDLFVNVKDISTIETFGNIQGSTSFYGGLDLGRKDDSTVLFIIDNNGKVVDVYRDRHKSWDTIVTNIVNLLRKYKAKCYIEVNNVGDVIYEMVKKQYSSVYEFQTSNSSKQILIENLIVAFQNKEIQIPTPTLFKALHDEIGTFTYDYNPRSRTIRYGHENGFHDDTIDSLALAVLCKKEKSNNTFKIRG
jgi:phage terminase large subunit